MTQRPVETPTTPFTPNSEQPLLHGINSAGATVFVAASLADATDPEDTTQNDEKTWNHQIRRWIPGPSVWVFIILIAVTGISFCPALLANKQPSDVVILEGELPGEDGVKILGSIFHFDWMETNKVSVDWSVTGYGKYGLRVADGFFNDTPPVNVAIDMYLNNPPPSDPMGRRKDTVRSLVAQVLNFYELDTITFSISGVTSFSIEHDIARGIQYFAPDDRYSFSAFVFAIDKASNESIPIIAFEIGSAGPGDFSTTSDVIPSRSNFTYNTGAGPITIEVNSHTVYANIGRSLPARALTYSMFAINWILTLCSIITTSVTFNQEGEVGVGLLPITVILTIPAIRNLYVGSPPFGIYLDVVGFFPQMLIVVSCTMVVLSSYALRSIRGKSATGRKEDINV